MEVKFILDFFKNYGWQLGLLSLSGIVILGLLKKIGVFKKLDEKYKKYVYSGISAVLSIVACTIYILITSKFEIISYLTMCGLVIVTTITAYHIYEHTGARWLWNKFMDIIWAGLKKLFTLIFIHKLDSKKIKSEMTKYGIEASQVVLNELIAEVEANKKLKEEKEQEAQTQPEIVDLSVVEKQLEQPAIEIPVVEVKDIRDDRPLI